MRVKYTFTTDIKDVPNGVHFHLSKFLGRRSVTSNLQHLMNLLLKEELNFSLISKKIADLREQLNKLDILLGEASTILAACQQFELNDKMPVQEFANDQAPPPEPPPQKIDSIVSPPMNDQINLMTLVKLFSMGKIQIKKAFVLLQDRNIDEPYKILLCEYIIGLRRLQEMLVFYLEQFAKSGKADRSSSVLIQSLIGTCAEIEQDIADAGLSLELH
jgi:hypothetical protein